MTGPHQPREGKRELITFKPGREEGTDQFCPLATGLILPEVADRGQAVGGFGPVWPEKWPFPTSPA
jgi:hypothetical protein